MPERERAAHVIGLGLNYGWQLTAGKHLTFDFYLLGGVYYRHGKITEHSGGYHPYGPTYGIVTYPFVYHQSGWFPSLQSGVKVGVRFGHRGK